MSKARPKWIAIGKQTGKYETRSQLLPSPKRNMTNQTKQSRQGSILKNYSVQFLGKLKIKKQKKPQQQYQSVQYQEREQFFNYNIEPLDSLNNNYLLNHKRNNTMKSNSIDEFSPLYAPEYYNLKTRNAQNDTRQTNKQNLQIHDSIVLEQHNVTNRQNESGDSFRHIPNVVNIDTSQSQILQAVSFISENQKNPKKNHFEIQYVDNSKNSNKQKILNNQPFYKFQKNSKTDAQIKLIEVQQRIEELKVVQQTLKSEIIMCKQQGKFPLFYGNKKFQQFILRQFQQIISHISLRPPHLKKQSDNDSFTKQFNHSLQNQLLDSSFRELNNGKMIQKMIINLQEKQDKIVELQNILNVKQKEIEQKQSILISKLELINSLHEELAKYKDAQNSSSRITSQFGNNSNNFSTQVQKLLRQKQIKNLELAHQIELIKEQNQELNNEKQSLQQEIFTLEQKIIGVQMQIQQRVRRQVQDITFNLQKKIKSEYQVNAEENQTKNNKNQYYLQTIDTLSKQITDLTEKCKSYEKYIRQQEKSQPSKNISQYKQYEQLIDRKNHQLEVKQNHLATIENQLSFKEKKLKDFQQRINRQNAQIQKQNVALQIKAEEIEKYQQELNAREQELYNWEKSLQQQDKLLSRKANQLQRQKVIYDQKVNPNVIMTPYPMTPAQQVRTIIMPSYPNAYSAVNPRNNQYPQMMSPQNYYGEAKIHYDRANHQNFVNSNQQFYQPSYGQGNSNQNSNSMRHNKMNGNSNFAENNRVRHSIQQNTDEDISQNHAKYPSHAKVSRSHAYNQKLQLNSSYEQEMKIKPSSAKHPNYNQEDQNGMFNKIKNNNHSKLYLSSAYDKKEILVQQILSKRRNEANQNQNNKSLIQGKNPLYTFMGKTDLKKMRSPTNQNQTLNYGKQSMEQRLRQHRQKFQSRKVYQKPSKDFSQIHRPISPLLYGNGVDFKKSGYQANKDSSTLTDKSYNSKMFSKSSIPGAININEKLQKLKQQIKRQVKNLE